MSRRTIHYWIETGQLDRDLSVGPRGYAPRPPVAHKLNPYKAIIDARLEAFPKLSAMRIDRRCRVHRVAPARARRPAVRLEARRTGPAAGPPHAPLGPKTPPAPAAGLGGKPGAARSFAFQSTMPQ